jgi:hypothetical protein
MPQASEIKAAPVMTGSRAPREDDEDEEEAKNQAADD